MLYGVILKRRAYSLILAVGLIVFGAIFKFLGSVLVVDEFIFFLMVHGFLIGLPVFRLVSLKKSFKDIIISFSPQIFLLFLFIYSFVTGRNSVDWISAGIFLVGSYLLFFITSFLFSIYVCFILDADEKKKEVKILLIVKMVFVAILMYISIGSALLYFPIKKETIRKNDLTCDERLHINIFTFSRYKIESNCIPVRLDSLISD